MDPSTSSYLSVDHISSSSSSSQTSSTVALLDTSYLPDAVGQRKDHTKSLTNSIEDISRVSQGALTPSGSYSADGLGQKLINTASGEAYPPPVLTLKSYSPPIKRGKEVPVIEVAVRFRFGPNREKGEQRIVGEGVGPAFIDRHNKLVANEENKKKLARLSQNMQRLAGKGDPDHQLRISEARNGLCMLAQVEDDKYKYEVLNALEESLRNDPGTPETSENLTTLASNFFDLITGSKSKEQNAGEQTIKRKEFKAESPVIQKKIGAIFDVLLRVLQHHHTRGYIGPIIPEIKAELTKAAIELGKVNDMSIFQGGDYSVDVPLARLQICESAAAGDFKDKLEALESLEYIIKNDPCTSTTAPRLVDFAMNYLKIINRIEFQKEMVEVQLMLVKVYDALIELLLRHYAAENISAITGDHQTEFVKAAKALENFNTNGNIDFKYHIRCALQGSRLLTSNDQNLLNIFKKTFQVVTGLASIVAQEPDAGINRIAATISTIDPKLQHTWYENVLTLRRVSGEAFEKHHRLKEMLQFIHSKITEVKKKNKENRWEFYFTAVDMLKEICLKSNSKPIRIDAFNGADVLHDRKIVHIGGLAALASLNSLEAYREMDKVKRLHRPEKKDPNIRVRQRVVESLAEIIKSAQDDNIKTMAKRILYARLKDEQSGETHPEIIKVLETIIPKQPSSLKKWLKNPNF